MTELEPPGVVAVTDGSAGIVEELQFTLGEGPGVDCFRSGSPILEPELRTCSHRWPGFTVAALEAGIGAIFAVPLRVVGGGQLGVLDLYRDAPGSLTDSDLLEAGQYAEAATSLLLRLQSIHSTREDNSVSGLMLSERAEIAQATGFVSGRTGMAPRDALALLRAQAFAEGRPVLALARAVLRRGGDV